MVRFTADIVALSPPLVIEKAQVDQLMDTIRGVLQTID
jgi:beta-alanine--pyruvate transaminase